jgi:hypothetical protein
MPHSAKALATLSHQVPRPTAEMMPAGMPMTAARSSSPWRQLQRHRQLLPHQLEHRLLGAHRFAQVTLESTPPTQ